jgi:hypothetical protein
MMRIYSGRVFITFLAVLFFLMSISPLYALNLATLICSHVSGVTCVCEKVDNALSRYWHTFTPVQAYRWRVAAPFMYGHCIRFAGPFCFLQYWTYQVRNELTLRSGWCLTIRASASICSGEERVRSIYVQKA